MNRLQFFRIFGGISQQDLAERTGLNQTRISRIERKILIPSKLEKKMISEALDKPLEIVFPEDEK